MNRLTIDLTKTVGKIKPVNGVGGGAKQHTIFDISEYLTEARIPSCRLHDIEAPFGSGEYVDIHCLFPDFRADENDPESYNFVLTDEYLKAIVAAGAEPFYRLGCSIEHQPIKRYTYPPKDFGKWARICEHIIAHYNEGWANGFHMNIRYWEIWNEPDLGSQMWAGPFEQYIELYKIAAKHLKQRFPSIRIGGAAFCWPVNKEATAFLTALSQDRSVPLDFFSWHNYCTVPATALECANAGRELLDKLGFTDTESILDEWNFVYDFGERMSDSFGVIASPKGTAFTAAMLLSLQKAPVDAAHYYDIQIGPRNPFNGLFDIGRIHAQTKVGVRPKKTYYAFRAFGEMRALGNEVFTETDAANLYVVAAAKETDAQLMVANYALENAEACEVSLSAIGAEGASCEILLLDGTHDMEPVYEGPLPETYVFGADSVTVIRIRK